eukprot:32244_1
MLSFNSDNSKIEDIMESIGNDTVNHDEEHTVDEDPTVAEDTTGDETLLTVDGKTTGDEALLTVDEDTTVDAATGVDKLNENVVKQTDDVNHDEDTIGDEALPTGAVVEDTTVDVPTGAKKPNEHVVHSSDDVQTPPKEFSINCEEVLGMWGYSTECTYDMDLHKHGANPTSDVFVRVGVIFYDGMPGTVDKVELDAHILERDTESEGLSFVGRFARSENKESYPLKITVKPTNSRVAVRNIKISIETKSVNADVTADTTPAAKHLTANLDTDQQNLLQNASESEEQEDVKEQTTVDTTPAGNSLLTRGLNWAWWKAG